MTVTDLVDKLTLERDLDDGGLESILNCNEPEELEHLYSSARDVSIRHHGNTVHLRALVEWSNVCRNDCLYCGIRCGNASLSRYTLSTDEILDACSRAYALGLRTFVLQGGENPAAAEILAPTVSLIKSFWSDAAVTLSLGELPFETYELLRNAGADRYLLRHETADKAHYAMLHPEGMALENRMDCLRSLKTLGYQVGTGMMVGSPFQSTRNLVADLRFIQELRPEMVGIGPFIPHKDTPLGTYPKGSAELTLKLYSIVRLMLPDANIPSTTALSVIEPEGRIKGILAGANVIMPNFSPLPHRADYAIYEGKASLSLEAEENQKQIEKELHNHGYLVGKDRGDYQEN